MDLTLKIILVCVILLALVVVKMIYDHKRDQRRLERYLKRTWGVPADRDYNQEQMEAIAAYYEANREEGDIDDITWNDLNMDQVYPVLNHTRTSIGEEYLYALLRKPITDMEEMEERERLIQCFLDKPEESLRLQKALAAIGKLMKMSVYQNLQRVHNLPKGKLFQHILACIAMLAIIPLCLIWPEVMVLLGVILLACNIISYYHDKAELDPCIRLFSFVVRIVGQCENVASVRIVGLEKYQQELLELTKCFRKFCRSSSLVAGGRRMGGDLLDSLMDYVRMLFHVDLIKICTMRMEIQKHQKEMFRMYEIIGYMDSMLSVASYRSMERDQFCVPEFVADEKILLETEQIRHPLLPEGVTNSLNTNKSVLLTGSNASGKSTFLKTVAINAVMAQTIHTALAQSYRSSMFHIASSMALRDNIMEQESYYMVEIKSLKRILDYSQNSSLPVLCFIDEVLRGTNTVERIASSSQILQVLANQGNLCFAATHDIELTYLLEKEYANYHFEEQITEEDVSFDYRLHTGRTNSRNAIKLLQMLGYDRTVIDAAEDMVQHFLETGKWQ
ncbi:MAG: hypothetical protein K2K70_08265 [Lachnospiraceae bacterium]|nr:hypothetical protein [Lachnospiraceae bacterium]